MSIIEIRNFYKPFEYQQAFDFYKDQHRAHWLADEVPLASDLGDWKLKLNESEKNLIGNILKSFAQTEVHVNDYWSTKVSVWFPKPEIQAMARVFADFESIHAEAYARLNEELGLDDFQAFLEDETSKAKIDRLVETPGETLEERALSLAIFSAFTEGVNLFSSFDLLMPVSLCSIPFFETDLGFLIFCFVSSECFLLVLDFPILSPQVIFLPLRDNDILYLVSSEW